MVGDGNITDRNIIFCGAVVRKNRRPTISKSPGARYSKSLETFRAHFGRPNSFCIFKTKASRGTKRCSYFDFYFLYNMWKDQLYRISGSEFRARKVFGTFEKRASGQETVFPCLVPLPIFVSPFAVCSRGTVHWKWKREPFWDDFLFNRVRLDRRVKRLVEVLVEELDCSRSFLLHVGPRATRRAVSLLVRLGRASEVSWVPSQRGNPLQRVLFCFVFRFANQYFSSAALVKFQITILMWVFFFFCMVVKHTCKLLFSLVMLEYKMFQFVVRSSK